MFCDTILAVRGKKWLGPVAQCDIEEGEEVFWNPLEHDWVRGRLNGFVL